jgi:uncharacterized protein (TIGR03435 family)
MEQLAVSIANFYGIGRLVVDRTGLTGKFDMDMEWAPMTQFRQPGNLDPPPDFADRTMNNLPTLFAALKEQLGLELEPARGPVPTVIIERVERPSQDENVCTAGSSGFTHPTHLTCLAWPAWLPRS